MDKRIRQLAQASPRLGRYDKEKPHVASRISGYEVGLGVRNVKRVQELTPTENRAAARLEGKTLPGGWVVVGKIAQPLGATGGCFSFGYLVETSDGRKGFLKALDYSAAFSSQDPPISVALQQLTESINFEKYVLARCRDRGLDRIVISIADGTFTDGRAGIDTVEYLIFELADGDARNHMAIVSKVDLVWRFKTLHHIATGLEQLHRNDIVHQDLKPSNVLVFNHDHSKLADFGRAACAGQNPPHACLVFPGDWTYAPPDVLYEFCLPDLQIRQLSFDAYLLGSMVVFFFTGAGTTALLLHEMDPAYADWQHFNGNVDDAKLHLRDAFGKALAKIQIDIPETCRADVIPIIQQLCDPDPSLRGHPGEKRGSLSQFSLERYVTRFDLLLKRAEVGLFGTLV